MKKEMVNLRTNFTHMSKNIKKVTYTKRHGSNQSTRGKSNKLILDDCVEDFFESSPKQTDPKPNELTLPVIRRSSPIKARAMSAGNGSNENLSDLCFTSSANGSTVEVTPSQKEQKEFAIRVIKHYNYDGTERER